MADKTYCVNGSCPFKDCARHLVRIKEEAERGVKYVSVANFDGVCRKYIGHLVDEVERCREIYRGKTVKH